MTMQANLTNRDAVEVPKPFVKWSYEPPRAADVPFALAQAIHHATLPPQGPAFVSIPMDDWARGGGAGRLRDADRAHGRRPRAARRRRRSRRWRSACARPSARCSWPDPTSTPRGGWDAAVELVGVPAPARVGLAGDRRQPHRLPGGPPGLPGRAAAGRRRRSREALAGHDLVLVAGSSVFPYYPNIPGDFLAEGAELIAITSDPDEAARAPMGDAIVADVALTLRALVTSWPPAPPRSVRSNATTAPAEREPGDREQPPTRFELDAPAPGDLLTGGEVHAMLAEPVPGRRHRRAGVAVEHRRAAQQAAPVAPRLLLLQRRRRPRLRARGLARRAARAARAPGRVRPRRGLRAVRDHRLLDGRRVLDPGQVPGAAQQRVLDPEVVRDARERRRARPAWTCRSLDVAATARSYGVPSRTVSGARGAARRASPTRSRRTGRGSCRSTSPREWRSL